LPPVVKAISYTRTGDPDVLQLVQRDVPEPGAGEVRVRVVVSGVNPTDWKSRQGGPGAQPMAFPEVVPNQDGAGVVDAVGPGVEGFTAGDRVWIFLAAHQRPTGTAQEFTVLPADRLVLLPHQASFELGASLGVPAMTAHRALTVGEDFGDRLAPGSLAGANVLVSGGAGAVGHAAVQLARWAGATVLTTVSGPEKAALASAAGAHHVVNYREQDVAEVVRGLVPGGVDLVVEVALVPNVALDLQVVRSRATIASYANNGGDTLTLDVRSNMVLNTRFQFVLLYTVGREALDAAAADVTAALLDDALPVGEEHGLPLHRFTLERTADAHAAVQGDAVGKVLVDVGQA